MCIEYSILPCTLLYLYCCGHTIVQVLQQLMCAHVAEEGEKIATNHQQLFYPVLVHVRNF